MICYAIMVSFAFEKKKEKKKKNVWEVMYIYAYY